MLAWPVYGEKKTIKTAVVVIKCFMFTNLRTFFNKYLNFSGIFIDEWLLHGK